MDGTTAAGRERRAAARRRRRAGVFVLAATLAGGLLAAAPRGEALASRPGAPARVVLGPGDTLWGVAERYAPQGVDPRAYVDALIELNDLRAAPEPGRRLRLPG